MTGTTACIAVLLIVCLARAEHIVASNVWIYAKGKEFRQRIERIITQSNKMRSRRKRTSQPESDKEPTITSRMLLDPATRWRIYKSLDGGRLPYLFMGIQSYRLLAWAVGTTGVKSVALRVVRGLWRFYAFTLWVSAIIWLYALEWRHATPVDDALMLVVASLLVIAAIGTLGGGVLATLSMGAFSKYHHSWPPPADERLVAQDISLTVGAAFFLYISISSLLVLLAARYSAVPGIGHSRWAIAADSAATALLGLISPQNGHLHNGASTYGVIVVTVSQAALALALVVLYARITSVIK